MPVGKTSAPPRQIIYLIVATILGIAAMTFLVLRTTDLAQRGDLQLNIGDEVFAPGNVERLSSDIEKFGPLLLSDPAGGDRDIYLQHLGTDDNQGWTAFAVRPIDATRDCFVTWQASDLLFAYNCSDETFGPDGEGLPSYPVTIDADGNMAVDLNAADRQNAPDGS